MLNSLTLLNSMTKHFPRWMDIRKRVLKSKGGLLLESVAEETANLQQAIDDYKKEFFLVNYLDDPDAIDYYIYYINIGSVDIESIKIVSPENLRYVTTIKEFYNSDDTYYYEDNRIYFHKEHVNETNARVTYEIGSEEFSALIHKYYVWNIFDEFAAFVGLRRHVDENNTELTNRILNVFKYVPNSTEDGLKNAIINEILNDAKNIYPYKTVDEIKDLIVIERPTPENLILRYDEFTTLLDKLGSINRDVYRFKQWDVDTWNYSLSSVNYLPHAWDYQLVQFQNGVGFEDDLRVSLLEDSDSLASCNILLYAYNNDTISGYLSDNPISKTIKLNLTKYDSDISGTVVRYKISAVAPYRINNISDNLFSSLRLNTKIDNNNSFIEFSDIIELGEDDELYINELTQSFVLKTYNGDVSLVRIKLNDLGLSPETINNTVFSVSAGSSDLPINIGVVFVYNTNQCNITNSHSGAFDYLYLYPKNATIYNAYNENTVFLNRTENVSMTENFSPLIPNNQLFIYTIKDIANGIATFTNNADIDEIIGSWSFGKDTLTITTELGTSNLISSNYTFEHEFILNTTSVPLTNKYIESLGMYASDYLSEYMVSSDDSAMTINYTKYNGPADPIDVQSDYFNQEFFEATDVGNFLKLKKTNIDEIVYIGTTPFDGTRSNIFFVGGEYQYTLYNNEGVIILNNNLDQDIYVAYLYKIPSNINIDINALYDIIDHDVNAYELVSTTVVSNISDEDTYDLNDISGYNQQYNVLVSGLPNNFYVTIDDDVVTFHKYSDESILVNRGYYYIDGNEYYWFNGIDPTNDSNITNVIFENTKISGDRIVLTKSNKNYIKNSSMVLDNIASTYSVDLINDKQIHGASLIGPISSCENYDRWITFGADLRLIGHNNGIGINITPSVDNGYAYLDITCSEPGDYYLSLITGGNITAFIGRDVKYDSMSFHKSVNMQIVATLDNDSNTLSCSYTQEDGYKYYLIITGSGMFDDVLLVETSKAEQVSHNKNINVLGLKVDERVTARNNIIKLYFDNRYGTAVNTEIDSQGYIINAPMVDWGMTKIKEYDSAEWWNQFVRSNVQVVNNYIQTINVPGYVESPPIYIDNPNIVKTIVAEINDIPFSNMTGFDVSFSCSRYSNGTYVPVGQITNNNNIASLDASLLTGRYLKIKVDMPANKVLGNIALYVEYKTTPEEQPDGSIYASGVFYSSVFDSYERKNYKVKSVSFDENSLMSSVSLKIRATKDEYEESIWTDWYDIAFNENGDVIQNVVFNDYRFFQLAIHFYDVSKVKINYIELQEVSITHH